MTTSFIIAHRGFSGSYPENTLKSFAEAIKLKPDATECDVHRTSDGKIVVMHDESVDRTTNGKGLIANLTLAQLRKLDAGSWKSPKFKGEKVPTLEELLDLVKGKLPLLIEIKDYGITQETVAIVRKFKMEDQVKIISFLEEPLLASKELAPLIPTNFICEYHGKVVELANKTLQLKCNGICFDYTDKITPEMVQYLRHRGLFLNLWLINKPKDIKKAPTLNADTLTSDYPDQLLKAVGR